MAAFSECEDKSSSNEKRPEISFTKSNKGKPLLIHENYVFKCNKITTNKKYWLCTERECGVYLHTCINDQLMHIAGVHKHPANPDQLQVKLVRDKMKERILVETTSITKIYDEEIIKANLSREATAVMPTIVEYRKLSKEYDGAILIESFFLNIQDLI